LIHRQRPVCQRMSSLCRRLEVDLINHALLLACTSIYVRFVAAPELPVALLQGFLLHRCSFCTRMDWVH
jgi:hypothetical protein